VYTNELLSAEARLQDHRRAGNSHSVMRLAALQAREHFSDARSRAQLSRFWAFLTRRKARLPKLSDYVKHEDVRASHPVGQRTIQVSHIIGTEGRGTDFDTRFRPLQFHTRDRWYSVATAMIQGQALPPIVVIQVGEHYFVRDGHHRVSAARTLGQVDIEAKITVWELSEGSANHALQCAPCATA
jgi:hypothetical protein